MIHVIATIQVAPGKRGEFLAAFGRIVDKVRNEAGCLEYGPTVDVPTNLSAQPPARPDAVIVVEKWADLMALEAHLVAPHMIEYRREVKDLVTGTELRVLQPV